MKDGRFLAVEVKDGRWKRPKDERERAQARFIALILKHGGVAGFITCMGDLETLIGG
jgi:hypothetical protein